jgi:hypothetical protein
MLLCAHVLRKWKTGREKMPRAKGVEFQIRGLLLGQKLATFLALLVGSYVEQCNNATTS